VQILTENNREERKISSQTVAGLTLLRSKTEGRYYRGTTEEFKKTVSARMKDVSNC
jgi:hypothetical protein